MTTLFEAAVARAAGVAAPADRPSQRRSALDEGSRPWVRASIQNLTLRASDDSTGLAFSGYASVTERAYEMYDFFGPYQEIVDSAAFDATLAQEGLDVPLVLQHDSLRRIARTTNGTLHLSVDDTGLLVEADLDPADPDVVYIVPKLRSGLVDEMSFKFHIDSGQWSPDYTEYRITGVNIHRGDVAIVGYGASPHTAGSGLRAPATKLGSEVVHEDDLLSYRAL
jgi:HK97 family phage prohead protease